MKVKFDLKYRQQIESGEYKVETVDGRQVRIVCWDAHNPYRENDIVALATSSSGEGENILRYYSNGHLISDSANVGNKDLIVVIPDDDERIRKIITDSVFYQYGAGVEYKDVLDYLDNLEKQKPVEKHDLVAKLKEHLANTPKEQLEAEWKELEHWNNIGPTVQEFLYGGSAEWSEEDKDYYDTIVRKLEVIGDDSGLSGNQIKFLREHCPSHCSEWSEDKYPKNIETDAVMFCFDKGFNITPYQAKMIAKHYYELGFKRIGDGKA